MSHPNEELLNDYVDNELTSSDRATLQQHLDQCAECMQTVVELQELVGAAAGLGDIEPSRDLLPKIRAVAVKQPSRDWMRWVAAAALIGFVALLVGLRSGDGFGVAQTNPNNSLEGLVASFHAAEAEYLKATEMLARGVEGRRDELDPETLAILDKNLALIDSAIVEVRLALDRDGAGVENTHLLTALYHKKLDVLMRASRLSS